MERMDPNAEHLDCLGVQRLTTKAEGRTPRLSPQHSPDILDRDSGSLKGLGLHVKGVVRVRFGDKEMFVYLITFTLNGPQKKYSAIYEFINRHDNVHVATSSYAIMSNYSADEIVEALMTSLDPNDVLYVFPIVRQPSGGGSPTANSWLKRHLP